MRPNQETGSEVHRSRSCLILQNKGTKLALYSWSKDGVMKIPKYTNPLGDHLKGKVGTVVGIVERVPRGIASDLAKLIL